MRSASLMLGRFPQLTVVTQARPRVAPEPSPPLVAFSDCVSTHRSDYSTFSFFQFDGIGELPGVAIKHTSTPVNLQPLRTKNSNYILFVGNNTCL